VTNYKTLEERIVDSYLIQSAVKFVKRDKSKLSENDQLILYDFTKNIYTTIKNTPDILFKEFHDDDAHPNRFNCSSYNKSYLKNYMRKAIKTIDDFMFIIYSIGLNNDIKIPKKYLTLYNFIGIENNMKIHDILKQFIGKEKLPFHNFIRCMYNENYQYFVEIFEQFSKDPKAYKRLIKWLKDNDYIYVPFLVNSEVKNSESCGMGFYKKVKNDEKGSYNFSMYGHWNIGLFMDYNVLIQEPVIFDLRLQSMRNILEKFNEFDDTLKNFICNYHARCSGSCNYCIQRHLKKNKNVKKFTIIVEHNNKKLTLCPIHYVYTYCWNTLNDERINGIIAYLKLMEKEHDIKK